MDDFDLDEFTEPMLDLLSEEDGNGHRIGCGVTACPYCGELECNFSCDESQADGFSE